MIEGRKRVDLRKELARVNKRAPIVALLRELDASDYKVLKRIEGHYSDEEWVLIKNERQAMREEINRLEAELASQEACEES